MDQAAEIQALFTDDSDSLHFDHGTLFSHSASPHQHFQIMGNSEFFKMRPGIALQ